MGRQEAAGVVQIRCDGGLGLQERQSASGDGEKEVDSKINFGDRIRRPCC